MAQEFDTMAAAENGPGNLLPESNQVEWAGLPVNLDLAFSDNQRDKVHAQHLLRNRGARLWRWSENCAQVQALGADPH